MIEAMRDRGEPTHLSNPDNGSMRHGQNITVASDYTAAPVVVAVSAGRYRVIVFAKRSGFVESFGIVYAVSATRGNDSQISNTPENSGCMIHTSTPLIVDVSGSNPAIIVVGGAIDSLFNITRLGG